MRVLLCNSFKILYFAHNRSQLEFHRRIIKYSHATFSRMDAMTATFTNSHRPSSVALDCMIIYRRATGQTVAQKLPPCDTLKHYCNIVHTMPYAHNLISSALSAALDKRKQKKNVSVHLSRSFQSHITIKLM